MNEKEILDTLKGLKEAFKDDIISPEEFNLLVSSSSATPQVTFQTMRESAVRRALLSLPEQPEESLLPKDHYDLE